MKRFAWVALVALLVCLPGCMLLVGGDEILYEETFAGTTSGDWYVGATASSDKWIDNGKYYTLVKEAVYTRTLNGTAGPFVDVQIDLDVDHILGTPGQSAGGLIFRAVDANNLYAFLVSAAGAFTVMKWGVGTPSTLLAWAQSPAINKGTTRNHLTVVAIGPSLSFLVNGTEVAMLTDTSHTSGGVGVIAVAFDAEVDVLEGFDNLIVQTAGD